VSFDVAAGEFVAVMGRNGAGKSTLLDLLAGVRSPAGGTVTLADRPLIDWTAVERARLLAHLPQQLRADLSVQAESLVLMGRYAHAARWFESDDDLLVACEAMTRCECLAFRDRTLATLSGGERQRVLLAACLAQRARVLLLDEPATYLDVDQQLQCFSVLRAEADRGAACVAVTHDINLALSFCTRLIVLADGRVLRDAPTDHALDDPAWLRLFSPRLQAVHEDGARPWVRYR
jgi:iron complex transport system ATP-binding protein